MRPRMLSKYEQVERSVYFAAECTLDQHTALAQYTYAMGNHLQNT
jgi:hypothetical protein